MKLADRTVTDFSDLLASGAPAPGGGSAAALEAALGAGLIAMVCRLTVDKERFAPHREDLLAIQERSEVLRQKLLEGMERDTDAFLQVSGAFALPKSTQEEKAARSAAIQRGLEACTRTPLEVMELAAEALELAASLAVQRERRQRPGRGGILPPDGTAGRVAECLHQRGEPAQRGPGPELPGAGGGAFVPGAAFSGADGRTD